MAAIPDTLPQAKACRCAPAKAVEKCREIITSDKGGSVLFERFHKNGSLFS